MPAPRALLLLLLVAGASPGCGFGPAPAAPDGLTATAGDRTVQLEWSAVEEAAGYQIYWNVTDGVTPSTGALIESDTAGWLHRDLQPGVTYYYVVTAFSESGAEGPASNEANATPVGPPDAPSGIAVARAGDEFTVTWSPSAGADSYDVHWEDFAEPFDRTLRCVDATPDVEETTACARDASSPYVETFPFAFDKFFAVEAVNEYGAARSAYYGEGNAGGAGGGGGVGGASGGGGAGGGGGTGPAAPTGLEVVGTDTWLSAHWNPVAGATAYFLYLDDDASLANPESVVSLDTWTTWDQSDMAAIPLAAGTTYHVRVHAFDGSSEGPPSSTVSVTPATPVQLFSEDFTGIAADTVAGTLPSWLEIGWTATEERWIVGTDPNTPTDPPDPPYLVADAYDLGESFDSRLATPLLAIPAGGRTVRLSYLNYAIGADVFGIARCTTCGSDFTSLIDADHPLPDAINGGSFCSDALPQGNSRVVLRYTGSGGGYFLVDDIVVDDGPCPFAN